ncbi:VTT domain-containing protein [Microbacterium sp. X-17]|uniref:DedA family protein n=1 Tax=Microbacterium sp. X-17 TaxID=3144404 RepID=UPI0031F50AD9
MGLLNGWLLQAAGQAWLYPILLVFFIVDGFATILPSETALVALAALSAHSGQPNLVVLGVTALVGAMVGDNLAYLFGRVIGIERWRWMRRPRVHRMFTWARGELDRRGATLIFTARYIPWGRVAVNYVAGQTRFPHRRFFLFDAFACATWVAYAIGIGLFAGQWVHDNPLLGVVVALAFAVVIGVGVDHLMRRWHRLKDRGREEDDL